VVDRQARHCGVDRVVVEGQRFGASGDHRRRTGRALGPHDGARLDREHPAIGRLVGAGAGADVEDRARIAERGRDPRGDPGVRPPVARVRAPMLLIVDTCTAHER
jgi:hypothetical protein